MVEYADGAVMAQLGTPDMRLPILYAMSWPERLPTGGKRLDFTQMNALTFEQPDYNRFPGLKLAYDALARRRLDERGAQRCERSCGGRVPARENSLRRDCAAGGRDDAGRAGRLLIRRLEQVFECDRAARQKAAALLTSVRAHNAGGAFFSCM